MKSFFNLLVTISKKRLLLFVGVLVLSAVSAVALRLYCKESYNATMRDRIISANARCGYAIGSQKKLLSIYYVNASNSDKVIQLLPSIKEPFSIGISNTTLTQNNIDVLTRAKYIEGITIVDCKLNPDGSILKKLSSCTNLKTIFLGCRGTSCDLPLKEICFLTQITELGLVAFKVPLEAFECVVNLRLKHLRIFFTSISDNHISVILKCDSLSCLQFDRCSFSDAAAIRKIAKIRNLEYFDISRCVIHEKILDAFIDHPSLKEIVIQDANLCEDDISLIKTDSRRLPKIVGTVK
jgi:hypothetical protein